MNKLLKYSKKDFKRVSWEGYGKTLETLYQKIEKYLKEKNIKIDAVVPILRAGAFPGTYLAYKLRLLKILPIQYKYLPGQSIEPVKLLDGLSLDRKIGSPAVFLLVENNHCFGTSAKMAAEELKKFFSSCKIIYVAAHMDYSHQDAVSAEAVFYGRLTNEARGLNLEEAKEKGLTNEIFLFPWENLEEEWAAVSGEPFNYNS